MVTRNLMLMKEKEKKALFKKKIQVQLFKPFYQDNDLYLLPACVHSFLLVVPVRTSEETITRTF